MELELRTAQLPDSLCTTRLLNTYFCAKNFCGTMKSTRTIWYITSLEQTSQSRIVQLEPQCTLLLCIRNLRVSSEGPPRNSEGVDRGRAIRLCVVVRLRRWHIWWRAGVYDVSEAFARGLLELVLGKLVLADVRLQRRDPLTRTSDCQF